MELKAKYFPELSLHELYEILKTRSEIFVVEQECPYLDPDGRDYDSLHVFLEEDGAVLAYLRAFAGEQGTAHMGRVLTRHHGMGLGGRILKEGIARTIEAFRPDRICIEAQCRARGFYAREGFRPCSEEFIVDGIPHINMVLEL